MFKQLDTQGTQSKTLVNDYLLTWLNAFIIDRKAQGVCEGTLHYYEMKNIKKSSQKQLISNGDITKRFPNLSLTGP